MHPMSRRGVLSAGAALAVAACTPGSGDSATPPASSSPAPPPDPDLGLQDDVARQEWDLIALYDAALASPGALDPAQLTLLRDQHREHAAALGSTGPPSSSSGPASSNFPPGGDVRSVLIDAEQKASGARTDSSLVARAPDLVRLLALIAASEAGHAEALRRST